MTVRERVREIQKQLRDVALSPDMAREADLQLSALLGNVNDELREADLEYKIVLLAAYRSEGSQNRGKVVAETSPEYSRYREAKDLRELILEMIRSCRSCLRSLNEELRLAR